MLVRFSDIRGHRSQIAALQRLVGRGQPGHAYLFEGPAGVGKDTVAQAFLGRLACLDAPPDAADPCGTCRSCLALQRGGHPDLQQLVKEGASIKIDQVRGALQRLRFDPVLGAVKGLVVESADLLREEAANALLKTLEEPSSRTVFVLVTSKPQLMLETIRSRCQVLRFAELSPDDLAAVLVAEGQAPDLAQMAAALAEGSLHSARLLCDPKRMTVVDFIVRFALALGSQPAADGAAFVEHLATRMVAAASDGDGDDDDGEPTPGKGRADFSRQDLQWVLDVLRAVLRDVVLVAAGIDARSLPHRRYAAELATLAARTEPKRLMAVVDACTRLEERMTLNPNPRLALAALLVEAGTRLRA